MATTHQPFLCVRVCVQIPSPLLQSFMSSVPSPAKSCIRFFLHALHRSYALEDDKGKSLFLGHVATGFPLNISASPVQPQLA